MFKRIFAILIVVTGLQMLLVGLLTGSSAEDQHPSSGEAAPLFRLTSLHGDTLALAELRGKFVIIHFAASW